MMQHDIQDVFVSNLRYLRRMRQLTQHELSIELGVSRGLLGAWEESRSFPTLEMLYKIAQYFKLTLEELTIEELPNDFRS